jgi:hypothetical protein
LNTAVDRDTTRPIGESLIVVVVDLKGKPPTPGCSERFEAVEIAGVADCPVDNV